MGTAAWFAVWLGALASTQVSAQAEANRLVELWARQRKEIRTAAITAEHFVYYPRRIQKGVLESFLAEVHRMVENGIDQVEGPTLTKDLPPDINRRHDWQRLSLLQDGPRCRAESRWRTPEGQARVTVLAFDGASEVHWRDAARQANLYRGRTAMAITDLLAFRMIPCLPPDGVISGDGSQLSIAAKGWAMHVDTATGLLRQAALGETIVMQYGARRFPGDIVFPRVVVRARYNGNLLEKLEVLKMVDARFNQPLPANAFEVPLPADATVVDARANPDRLEVYRLTKATDNAAAIAADASGLNRACHPPHEIIGKGAAVTPCRLEGGRCAVHDNRNARGQLEWIGAACTDPNCHVQRYDPRNAPQGIDLWINEYKLACSVTTTDTSLTCQRVIEYVPCYINHAGVNVCTRRDAK